MKSADRKVVHFFGKYFKYQPVYIAGRGNLDQDLCGYDHFRHTAGNALRNGKTDEIHTIKVDFGDVYLAFPRNPAASAALLYLLWTSYPCRD